MSSYNKTYYLSNKSKFMEKMRKYYYDNKIEILEQKKKYYENSINDKMEYNFYEYYIDKYDLSTEIINILYGIKENNNIKKFKNINYYITIAEMYNIEIN